MFTDEELKKMMRKKKLKTHVKDAVWHLRLHVQERDSLYKPRRIEISLRTPHEHEALHAARVLLAFLHVWGLTLTNKPDDKRIKAQKTLPLFIVSPKNNPPNG